MRIAYQLYSELDDYKPKIWRRFIISAQGTLERLAFTLMALYKMDGSHLFYFCDPKTYEYFSLIGMLEDAKAATAITLRKVQSREGQEITFEYDFGDSWEITVRLEKIIENPNIPPKKLPLVLEGAGYGIIEDCGGVLGLENIAAVYEKRSSEEYEDYCDRFGYLKELDLTAFDVKAVNESLKYKASMYESCYYDYIYEE